MSGGARRPGEDGFALLAVLALVALGGGVLVTMLPTALRPKSADARARTETRLAAVDLAIAHATVTTGTLPGSLGELDEVVDPSLGSGWIVDPWSPSGAALAFVTTGNAVALRSVGPDRRANTGDDVVVTRSDATAGRQRTRGRLRVLRAAFLESALMDTATMSAADRVLLRNRVHEWASIQRSLEDQTAAARVALEARQVVIAADVAAVRAANGLTMPIPVAAIGPGGLMEALGLPDARAVDGFGTVFDTDPTVGIRSRGADRTGGTTDDL